MPAATRARSCLVLLATLGACSAGAGPDAARPALDASSDVAREATTFDASLDAAPDAPDDVAPALDAARDAGTDGVCTSAPARDACAGDACAVTMTTAEFRTRARDVAQHLYDWLTAPDGTATSITLAGGRTVVVQNGMDKINRVVVPVSGATTVGVDVSALTSTSICLTIPFLRLAGTELGLDTSAVVQDYADVLIQQFQRTSGAQSGGVVYTNVAPDDYATTFGNATCGLALLDAYAVTGQTRFRDAADAIGLFLAKLKRPSLLAPYATFRFVASDGSAVPEVAGWLDELHADGSIVAGDSLWNSIAIEFYRRLTSTPGTHATYTTADADVAFYAHGGALGDEYYAPRYTYAGPQTVDASGQEAVSHDDNQWHRRSDDSAHPSTEAIGSDKVEYLMVALFRRCDPGTLALYDQYVTSPPSIVRDTTTGCPSGFRLLTPAEHASLDIDPYVGLSDLYAFGSATASGCYAADGATTYFNHGVYDFDAILWELKAAYGPCQSRHALDRLLTGDPRLDPALDGAGLGSLSRWLYASLEHDLSPHASDPHALTAAEAAALDAAAGHAAWSAGEMVRYYTRGSSTVAHNASLLLRALATADATAAACGFAP